MLYKIGFFCISSTAPQSLVFRVVGSGRHWNYLVDLFFNETIQQHQHSVNSTGPFTRANLERQTFTAIGNNFSLWETFHAAGWSQSSYLTIFFLSLKTFKPGSTPERQPRNLILPWHPWVIPEGPKYPLEYISCLAADHEATGQVPSNQLLHIWTNIWGVLLLRRTLWHLWSQPLTDGRELGQEKGEQTCRFP